MAAVSVDDFGDGQRQSGMKGHCIPHHPHHPLNDHEPIFEKNEYPTVLSELVPIGTYVASITAIDQNTGINSNIFFAIVAGNEKQWFDIDASPRTVGWTANDRTPSS